MRWFKITHSGGTFTVNLENLSLIERYQASSIRIYPTGAANAYTLTFASANDREEIILKLFAITNSIDLNNLVVQ